MAATAIGVWLTGSPIQGRSENIDAGAVERIPQAASPAELRKARKAVFDHASQEQLQELTSSPHNAVAFYAAWQEMVGYSTGRVEKGKVDRFLGFVEGRLMVRIPDWWQKTLRSSTEFGDGCPPFFKAPDWLTAYRGTGVELTQDDVEVGEWADGKWKMLPQKTELRAPAYMKLRLQKDSLVVTANGTSAVIPTKLLNQGWEQLDVLLEGPRCYLATHSDRGYGFPLICFNETKGVLWRAEVWSAAICGPTFGYGYQRVALVGDSDRIIVFGAEPHAMFIEAFDTKTGKSLFRFSSWYYED